MNQKQLSDSELWAAVVSDDATAFTVLYHRYWKKIYKTVNYYVKNTTRSEEILSDVFVTIWNKRTTLRIENFNAYITVCCRYQVFKHFRKLKINPIQYIDEYTEDMFLIQDQNNIEHLVAEKDFEIELKKGLAGLPKKCREIFWESRVKNISNETIAANLNISRRTVENQITIALKYLRENYKELTLLLIFCKTI